MNRPDLHYSGEMSKDLGNAYLDMVKDLLLPERNKQYVADGLMPQHSMTWLGDIYDHSFLVTNIHPVIRALPSQYDVDTQHLFVDNDELLCGAGILSAPYSSHSSDLVSEAGGVTHIKLPIAQFPAYLSVITGPGPEAERLLYALQALPFHMVQAFIPNGSILALMGESSVFKPYLLEAFHETN